MEEHVPARIGSSSVQKSRSKRLRESLARTICLARRLFRRDQRGHALALNQRGQALALNQRGQALALNQRGQALVEYMLVLIIAFVFTHQVFFNQKWGFKGVLQKTMLRLGSFVEQNLKSGTKVGGSDGKLSLDPFAGTDRWSN